MVVNNNIIFKDKKSFEKTKDTLKSEENSNLCLLADFDRTLTYATFNGEKTPSLVAVLRSDKNYLGEEYSRQAKKLADTYLPIENNLSLSSEERREKMSEWWRKHSQILIDFGLNKKHLLQIIDERRVGFRDRTKEVFCVLENNNIPLLIISASAVGEEPIRIMIKKELGFSQGVYIISNSFVFDNEGFAVSYNEPLITINNKDQINIKEKDFYSKVKDKSSFILLGDSVDDVKMADNFNYNNIIKICFLSDYSAGNIEEYKNIYDVLVTGDSSMRFVEDLITEITNG